MTSSSTILDGIISTKTAALIYLAILLYGPKLNRWRFR